MAGIRVSKQPGELCTSQDWFCDPMSQYLSKKLLTLPLIEEHSMSGAVDNVIVVMFEAPIRMVCKLQL